MQSSITISQRAPGILNTDFRDLLTNIVCYPRIHYAYPSFVGLDSDLRAASIRTTDDMTRAILDPSSQLMDMRRLENKLGVALFYRGYVEPFEVLKAL